MLEEWRKNNEELHRLRHAEEDVDAVGALHHQPIDPELRHKEFPKLAKRHIEKREDHDHNVREFEVSRC